MKKFRVSLFAVFLTLALILSPAMPAAQVSAAPGLKPGAQSALDVQSTTGPTPPARSFSPSSMAYVAGSSAKVIAGIPPYIWLNGCGPTTAGMLIGYWDAHGYDWLIRGSAATQTTAVNEAISSTLGLHNHYTDYALPIDDGGPMQLDRSQPPFGDEHPDNSLADFMKTSQSYRGNRYGWSWSSDIGPALSGYINMVSGGHFKAVTTSSYWSNASFNWDMFTAQIDAGHPMILLVDSDGDGRTDHFIPAVGYDASSGTPMYAAYTTWDTSLHWFHFAPMTVGAPWGIYGGQTLSIAPVSLTVQTFPSVGTQDGWVRESGENSGTGGSQNSAATTLMVGDSATDQQYSSILSFNTGTLPDTAVITGLALKVIVQSVMGSGDPLPALHGFMVDIKKGPLGAATLQNADFQTAANKSYGPFNPPLTAGKYSINLGIAKAYVNKLATGAGLTQIRLRFQLDDNDDGLANVLNLYSGNAGAAKRPVLVVTYFVP